MQFPHPLPVLSTPRLTLRAPRPSDADDRLALARPPQVYAMLGLSTEGLPPYTREHAEHWVAGLRDNPAAWVIEHEGRAVGEIMLHSPVDHDRRAMMAIAIIDPACHGKGLGREAITALCRYAFGPLGLHRLSVRVLATNPAAIRTYEAVGFRREGVEREAARVGNGYVDDVLLGLLATEFRG